MSKKDMVVKIMNTMIVDSVSTDQIRKIMAYVEKVVPEHMPRDERTQAEE